MTYRRSNKHGANPVHVEPPRPDELHQTNADDTAANLAKRRARGRPFEKGNRAAAGRPPALALLGVKVDEADPLYRRVLGQAGRYRRRRVSELCAVYGYVSAGAAGLIASSSLALAASRYCYAKSAEIGDTGLLKLGSSLANDARQAELAAVELCQREAANRPKQANPILAAIEAAGRTPEEPKP